jgi:hypothetical protein
MQWLGLGRIHPDEVAERARIDAQLRDQERRILAVDRALQVIQRRLEEPNSGGR